MTATPAHPNLEDPHATIRTIRRIAEAGQIEDVWHMLVSAVRSFGFERVNYGLTRTRAGYSIGDPKDVLFLSTHALDRVRAHHDSGFYLKTPEYRWVMENVGACSWGWTRVARAENRLSAQECAAMDGIDARRERAGYTISFADDTQRCKGAMGLAAPAGVSQGAVDGDWQRCGDQVTALCNMAHFKLSQMPLPVPGAALTTRQREMLEWIADGKTLRDICVLTGLSLSAVEKHLRRARDRLTVETTAQAVAKASFLNQMFVAGAAPGGSDVSVAQARVSGRAGSV